jgi:hypothetical protein
MTDKSFAIRPFRLTDRAVFGHAKGPTGKPNRESRLLDLTLFVNE